MGQSLYVMSAVDGRCITGIMKADGDVRILQLGACLEEEKGIQNNITAWKVDAAVPQGQIHGKDFTWNDAGGIAKETAWYANTDNTIKAIIPSGSTSRDYCLEAYEDTVRLVSCKTPHPTSFVWNIRNTSTAMSMADIPKGKTYADPGLPRIHPVNRLDLCIDPQAGENGTRVMEGNSIGLEYCKQVYKSKDFETQLWEFTSPAIKVDVLTRDQVLLEDFWIRPRMSDWLCLMPSTPSPQNGSDVILKTCEADNKVFDWRLINGNFVNSAQGTCLDIQRGGGQSDIALHAALVPLQMWSCADGNQQQLFSFASPPAALI